MNYDTVSHTCHSGSYQKITLRQSCTTPSIPLSCKVCFNYAFFESSSLQEDAHLQYTAYTKSTRPPLRDNDMLQMVKLIQIFKSDLWEHNTYNRQVKYIILHSVLSGKLDYNITQDSNPTSVRHGFSSYFSGQPAAV